MGDCERNLFLIQAEELKSSIKTQRQTLFESSNQIYSYTYTDNSMNIYL